MSVPRPDVLWATNRRGRGNVDGWAFPLEIERVVRAELLDMSTVHLFGGKARWGTRLDIDASIRPDVIADAWLPPFGPASFDAVVLDPPCQRISASALTGLLQTAAMIARRRIVWLHTVWCPQRPYLRALRSWLVRCGDICHARCLQVFEPIPSARLTWPRHYRRGPAIRYNRWLAGEMPLPLLVEDVARAPEERP